MTDISNLPPAGTPTACPDLATDLLRGVREIAAFLGMARRVVSYHIECERLPVFRLGALICARKSTLLQWVAEQERASVRNAGR